MTNITISVGEENFELLRTGGSYYIDKTKLIIELLQDKFKVNLITRPRRFGKTLTMSMLKNFFDIRKDSQKLFEELEIAKHERLCAEWMNQYPVLFLSFKDIANAEFTDSYNQLVYNTSSLCVEHAYLLESGKVDESDKKRFQKLKDGNATATEVTNSLFMLTRMMHMHYGKPAILLIDEYDVPLAKASEYGYYQKMLGVIRSVMSTSFKTNDYLQFAIVTGCLRIAKESIFTGTNHFVMNSICEGNYMDAFGFTEIEVRQMLRDANLEIHINDMRRWYDGYHFGNHDIYCPWDVVNHAAALIRKPEIAPGNYWKDTSHNDIIRRFISKEKLNVNDKLETLLAGGYVKALPNKELTYDFDSATESDFWNILYLTGYLTSVGTDELYPDGKAKAGELCLKIPNEEIKTIFGDTIVEWFKDASQNWDKRALFDAVWNGDDQKLTTEMTKLLRKTISYHDYREDFYHAFLAGIFAGAGYRVESNKERGEGRSDVVIQDYGDGRIAIFEAKYSQKKEYLQRDCEAALRQIDNKQYAEEFMDDYEEVLCFGISFFRKRCMVLLKNGN